MASSSLEEEFVQGCVEDYEQLMDEKYHSLESTAELEKWHQILKIQQMIKIPKKWSSTSTGIMSPGISQKVSLKLEEIFEQLKNHFETSKIREAGLASAFSIKRAATNYYTNEMDKYVNDHPRASPNELQTHSDILTQKTIGRAKQEARGALTANIIGQIRAELTSCFKKYQTTALMSSLALTDPALGIDLGTTNCCIMVFYLGKVTLIPNRPQGNSSTTPSYVAFHEDGSDTFGTVAKEESYRYPETTIYDAKRMIGRSFKDKKLQADRKKWPFEVVDDDDNPKIKAHGRTRYPHEISARLLTRFRQMAEEYLGLAPGTIRKAVVTVPAYFTEPQRRATSQAAKCAGLQVLKILSEPTAAAIAYSWERRESSDAQNVLVYDLGGGGTFDVAIAKVKSDDVEILGVHGDTHLGGQDFDQLLMQYCLQEFKNKEKRSVDLEAYKNSDNVETRKKARRAICRLKLRCEIAKDRLSCCEKTNVEIDSVYADKDLVVTVTKKRFEELILDSVNQTLEIVKIALHDTKSKGINSKADIDDVILVGGATRIPLVANKLSEYFEGKQLSKNINPDQAVAYGAAIHAAILNNSEDIRQIHVQDVTPLPVGISVNKDGDFAEVIPKNAKIPCDHTKKFATYEKDQRKTRVEIFQGESKHCKDNKQLGDFLLEGLIPKRAGEEKVLVKMSIDASGILQQEAEATPSRKKNAITIKAERLGMNDADIERIEKECAALKTETEEALKCSKTKRILTLRRTGIAQT